MIYLIFPFSYSHIGKTDQNTPLIVSQSCQRPQRIPQQGKKWSDRFILKLCCLLLAPGNWYSFLVFLFHLLIMTFPSPAPTPFYTYLANSLFSHLPPFFPCACHFVSCLTPSSCTVSYPVFTLTPIGSQGAFRLPPADRLRWHHGSSILSKRRLGPCEFLILISSSLLLSFFSSFLAYIVVITILNL